MTRVEGDGWKEALDLYQAQRDDLFAGHTPRTTGDGLAVAELCNKFLTAKHHLLDNDEIVPRTFADYKRICDRLVAVFGKRRLVDDLAADDFSAMRQDISKTCGPVRLGGEIQKIRMVFKFGFDAGLIDLPVRYGPGFKKPNQKTLRINRAKNGSKMFEADEIRTLLSASPLQLRAMILLGVNCGFGNHNCGTLPMTALDLDRGLLDYPRPKTGIHRRCPLWEETIEALKAVLTERPIPKTDKDKDLVFITRCRTRWAKDTMNNPISAEFRKLLDDQNLHRHGRGFYALRHVFETIGGESRDQVAVNLIMGHADSSMAAAYRKRVSDERLRDVVTHVHTWLFGEEGGRSDDQDDKCGSRRLIRAFHDCL